MITLKDVKILTPRKKNKGTIFRILVPEEGNQAPLAEMLTVVKSKVSITINQ